MSDQQQVLSYIYHKLRVCDRQSRSSCRIILSDPELRLIEPALNSFMYEHYVDKMPAKDQVSLWQLCVRTNKPVQSSSR